MCGWAGIQCHRAGEGVVGCRYLCWVMDKLNEDEDFPTEKQR